MPMHLCFMSARLDLRDAVLARRRSICALYMTYMLVKYQYIHMYEITHVHIYTYPHVCVYANTCAHARFICTGTYRCKFYHMQMHEQLCTRMHVHRITHEYLTCLIVHIYMARLVYICVTCLIRMSMTWLVNACVT